MRLQPVLPEVIGTPRAAYLTTKASPSMFHTGYGENVGKGLGALADAGLKAIRGFAAIDERNTDQIATEYAAACKQFITENQGDADALRSFDGRRQQILEQVTEGKGFYTSSRLQAKLRAIDYANTGYVNNRVQGLDRQADISASQGMVEAASAAFTVDPSPETKTALRDAYIRLAQATGTYANPGGAKRMQEDYDAGRILTSGGYREIVADDEADRHMKEDADRGRAFMENRIRQSDAERAVRTHGARAQAFEDGFQKLVDRAMLAHAKSYMDKGDYAAARAFMQQSDASDAAKKPFLDTCDRLIGLQDAASDAIGRADGIFSDRRLSAESSDGRYFTQGMQEEYLRVLEEMTREAATGDEAAKERLKAFQSVMAVRQKQCAQNFAMDLKKNTEELSSLNAAQRSQYIAEQALQPGNPLLDAMDAFDQKMREHEAGEAAAAQLQAMRVQEAATTAVREQHEALVKAAQKDIEWQGTAVALLQNAMRVSGVLPAGEYNGVSVPVALDMHNPNDRRTAYGLFMLNDANAKAVHDFCVNPQGDTDYMVNTGLAYVNNVGKLPAGSVLGPMTDSQLSQAKFGKSVVTSEAFAYACKEVRAALAGYAFDRKNPGPMGEALVGNTWRDVLSRTAWYGGEEVTLLQVIGNSYDNAYGGKKNPYSSIDLWIEQYNKADHGKGDGPQRRNRVVDQKYFMAR